MPKKENESAFTVSPERLESQTAKNKALFADTYRSLFGRTLESGYACTSVTGAYDGMFVRDTSIHILAHVACGDYGQAAKILNYTLQYHQSYGYNYPLHIMGNGTPPISDAKQADTAFFLIHAWCQYMRNAPQSDAKDRLEAQYISTIAAFADYYFDNGFFNEKLGLLRNPLLEHSRDTAYFNGYDLLTNVYASQSLHELSLFVRSKDPAGAAKFSSYADKLAAGIHANLVAVIDGKTVYAEMKSVSKVLSTVGKTVEDDTFYVGFSWVNMAPAGAGWYAINLDIMKNTYEKYLRYGGITYYGKYKMLEAVTTFRGPGDYSAAGNHVIGKGLAWEIMFCYDTGNYGRVNELIRFLEEHSDRMYRETWLYSGGGSDTANQEHASWMILANQYVFRALQAER